jgi:predicted nucleotidyltransferase
MDTVQATEQRLREALAPFGLRLAILFGSMAKGTVRMDSDLDVAVLAQGPLTSDKKMRLMETLALTFDRPVDLIDLHSVGEPLLGRILTEGRLILGTNAERGDLLYRHLVNQEDFVPLQQRILKARRQAWLRQ